MYRSGRRRISARKLNVLIDHLPPESATMTALRRDAPAQPAQARGPVADPADSPWSPLEMLAATIVDELRILRWAYGTAHGGKAPAPSPLRRPGTGSPPRSRMTDEMRRRIDPRLRAVPDPPEEIPALPAGG